MASVRTCLDSLLGSQLVVIFELVFIYLVLVAITVGIVAVVDPISSLEELDYELREFVHYYKETSWWWLTTFFTSVVALTVGSGNRTVLPLEYEHDILGTRREVLDHRVAGGIDEVSHLHQAVIASSRPG